MLCVAWSLSLLLIMFGVNALRYHSVSLGAVHDDLPALIP